MKTRSASLLGLVPSLIGFCAGYIFTNSVEFALCLHEQYNCRDFFNKVGDPLFFGMGALAIVFLALVFFTKAWGAWKKFAIWYVPIATFIFIFYKDPGSMNLISPYAETVFMWVSGIYVVASLAIIARASVKKA